MGQIHRHLQPLRGQPEGAEPGAVEPRPGPAPQDRAPRAGQAPKQERGEARRRAEAVDENQRLPASDFDRADGIIAPLPGALGSFYGKLRIEKGRRHWVSGNLIARIVAQIAVAAVATRSRPRSRVTSCRESARDFTSQAGKRRDRPYNRRN